MNALFRSIVTIVMLATFGSSLVAQEVPEGVALTVRALFQQLAKRDLTQVDELFVGKEEYQGLDTTAEGETAHQFNYKYVRGEFADDCKSIMHNLPLVGDKLTITKLSLSDRHIAEKDPDKTPGIRVECLYGDDRGRLVFITPPLLKNEQKWKFCGRFEMLMRFATVEGIDW